MHDSLLNDIVLHLLVMLISLRLSYWSKVKVIRCDNRTEFKNKEMNQFYEMNGILRQYSVARTPQQNGVAERRNKTLIKAVRTMLADSKLPTTFWAEAVNIAFYVQNRVSQDDRSKPSSDDGKKVDEDSRKDSEGIDQEKENNVNSTNNVNVASTNKVNAIGGKTSIELPLDPIMTELEDYSIFEDDEDVGAEADMHNLDTTIQVSPILTTRIQKDHPLNQVIRDFQSATQTRRMSKSLEEHGFVSTIQQRTNHKDLQSCLFACFLSQEEPEKVIHALKDPSWIEAMQEEILQFKLQEVWTLVDLPNRKKAIGTKWVFRNKKDERGIMIRNKARLVAQGIIVQLEDAEGVDCLPNATIFKQLTLMGIPRDEEDLGEDASNWVGGFWKIDANEDITLVNDDNKIFDVDALAGEEVFVAEQSGNVVEEVVAMIDTASTIPVSVATITDVEITLAQALAELKSAKPKADKVMIQEPEQGTTTTTPTTIILVPKPPQNKGKWIMIEEPVVEQVKSMKRLEQMRLDEELAFKLQAEEEEEERLAREKAQQIKKANIAWDDVQAKQRRKHFAAKRAEEKRNRPPTRAQQKNIMCTYLKNMEGWKPKSLKNKTELMEESFKKAKTKLEENLKKAKAEVTEGSSKRAGEELEQENEEEVAIDAVALATKPSTIVD
ncbi:putative ribonuclease H-like domain-containing protein [Tanacetum coccineum]